MMVRKGRVCRCPVPAPTNDIDSGIAHHENALLNLRSRRNHLAPISRLLPELLTAIFRLVVFSDAIDTTRPWETTDPGDGYHHWFNGPLDPMHQGPSKDPRYIPCHSSILLSHICREWRALARDDALLWSHVLMTSEKWAWRMLERSKGAPLTVRTSLISRRPGDSSFNMAYAALQQLHRIRVLSLIVGSGSRSETAIRQLTTPAPMLESISITNVVMSHIWDTDASLHLPDDIFGGTLPPRLFHLSLSGCDLPLNSFLLKGGTITSLEFSQVKSWQSAALGQILDVLRNLPLLEYISLRECLPNTLPGNSEVDAHKGSISFPRLVRIDIRDTLQTSASFLQNLSKVPPTASMQIAAMGIEIHHGIGIDEAPAPPDASQTQIVLEAAAPCCIGTRTVGFSGFCRDGSGFIDVKCWDYAVTEHKDMHLSSKTKGHIAISTHSRAATTVKDVVAALALDGVQVLLCEVVDYAGYHLELWATVFARMPSVETLHLNAQMLAVLLNTAGAANDLTTLFPALHTLVLTRAIVSNALFNKLRRFLAARPGRIREIRLRQSSIRLEHLAELRTLVERVDAGDSEESEAPAFATDGLFGEDLASETEINEVSLGWLEKKLDEVDVAQITNPFGEELDEV
ncbi:hypothetical protein OF83DRAFT_1089067 [Amylostereum chailletii]|nr:hypothetical protein OF83DRAFT_1089067 [Amylostereum chailletii]